METKNHIELSDILFRYERLTKLVEMVQVIIAQDCEISKFAIDYTLYEIKNCLEENNGILEKLLEKIPITKTEAEE